MKANKKLIRLELLKIALQLPENYVDTEAYRTFSGEQINDIAPELKAKIDSQYRVKVSDYRRVNHFKRLIRVQKTRGWDGVVEYVKGVTEMELQAMVPTSIGGINTEYDY